MVVNYLTIETSPPCTILPGNTALGNREKADRVNKHHLAQGTAIIFAAVTGKIDIRGKVA